MRSASLLILFCLLFARPAAAHRNFVNITLETGSGSLAQQSLAGQWGFSPTSPFYFYGELSHEAFYLSPDDNSLRGLGELGVESLHFGFALRGGYLSGPFESLGLYQLGGTLSYRFVPWNISSHDSSVFLKRDDRQAAALAARQQEAKTREKAPTAPLLSLAIDQFGVSSLLSQYAAINALRIEASLRLIFEPYWTLVPSAALYNYDNAPSTDPAGSVSYGSRALRLIRLGPDGAYSGIFGLPDNSQQIYSQLKLFPLLQIDAAITRVSLDTPSYIGYSVWFGFDRFLTDDHRWAVSPAYEQYFLEGRTYSYFTIAFRYGAASSWAP